MIKSKPVLWGLLASLRRFMYFHPSNVIELQQERGGADKDSTKYRVNFSEP